MVKNTELGKAKTRLAKDIGPENALMIYKELLNHTCAVSKKVIANRKVFYSDYIENNDIFHEGYFEKNIQKGDDLGEKMHNAIVQSAGEWADKIIVIGSDCAELNTGIIEEGFLMLDKFDTVLGPAEDGGYYLIGLKVPNADLFINRNWSHDDVLLDTLIEIKNQNLTHYLLPTLKDVDHVDDLPPYLKELLDD